MTPQEYCEERAAASGSSFYISFKFLSPERRQAITAFYAFCREVDDVVDECKDAQIARIKLDWWRGEIAQMRTGNASHPVTRALANHVDAFNISNEQLEEILDGMEMDIAGPDGAGHVRYADFKSLRLYCHRVAGVVGEVAAQIFGYTERGTLKYAAMLGLAFQLTNIIRDVGDDARRGRIYLPQDELAEYGVSNADILAHRDSAGFQKLMEFQSRRALETYAAAFALLPTADRKAQRPGLIMAAIYRALLEEIRKAEFPVLTSRVSLPPARKLWIAGKTWLLG